MKGQFSRLTARRARRYSGVRLQQGRVHLDADFNEQVDIAAWRDQVTTRDLIGPTGAPVEGGGFALSAVVALTGLATAGTSLRAVGTRGAVLASEDSGTTWAVQPVPAAVAERDLLAVDQFDAATTIATTSAGEVLVQTDGSTWTVQAPAAAAGSALNAAQLLTATTAWVVGAGGLIIGTTNGGAAWATRAAAGVTEALRAVHFATATTGWAVGDAARIVRTTDGGASWAPQPAPAGTTARLNAVRFAPDALHGWAVGDAGTILSTTDGGVTWVARSAPAGVDAALRGLDVVSTATVWAVGDGGTVLRTTDGGGTWMLVASSAAVAAADLRAVRAQTAATARVAGDLSTLASVTIAGGTATWQPSPVLPGRDLAISAGRMYVDGVLVENDRSTRYLTQADLAGTTVPSAGTYRAYLDVWTRHLTALDRPELREVALGGPDTSTRTQTVWQVRIDPTVLPGTTTCADVPAGWAAAAESTGHLRARGAPMPVSTDDCLVPAGGGYRRLENLLYRVEIQTPGGPGTATFKWSRENGSVASRLTSTDPAATAKTVTIADPGRAPDGDFAGAAFIELTDDRRVLAGEPGVLLAVLGVTGTVIRVQTAPPAMSAFGAGALVRRWDGTGSVVAGGWRPLATTDAAVPEDGVDVEFGSGTYVGGDYWTIPARTLMGDVEWPRRDGAPAFMPREGDQHRFALLAIVTVDATGAITVGEDCRTLFPPLGGLETLVYVSGDGQEVPRGGALQLPDPAVVGVTRGSLPVPNARVRFSVEDGGTIDGLTPDKFVTTDDTGSAQVSWTLADKLAPQHLTAELLDVMDARLGTPVRFQARVRSAASVSYEPTCPDLAGATTVQEAIDALCKRPAGERGGGCCHTVGRTEDQAGEYPDIVTALRDLLLERGHRQVCLCLLPGDHELPSDDFRAIVKEGEVETLELGGRGARLLLEGRLVFEEVDRVILRELVIEARDGQGLRFGGDTGDGGLAADERMRVDLVDLTVRAMGAPRDEALVVFEGCGQVRVTGCGLAIATREDARIRDVLPERVAIVFETAATADAGQLRGRVAQLLELPDHERRDLARQLERAVAERPDVFVTERSAVVARFSERLLRSGAGMPSAAQLTELRLEWREFAGGFGEGEGGFPAAVLFVDSSPDASLEGNQIRGGIAMHGSDRDLESEVQAELPFRFHDVQEVPDGTGRLRLDGNVLDWVSIGAEASRALASTNGDVAAAELLPALFAEMLVTNNTFRGAPHILLATAVTVHGNVFERAVAGEQAPRLGFVASAVTSATGNLGPDRKEFGSEQGAQLVLHGSDRAEAANARLTIV